MSTVYVLHFERPVFRTPHELRHYVGWTSNLPNRLYDHRHNGAGANFTKVAHRNGIGFVLVATIADASVSIERAVKAFGAKHLCQLCGAQDAQLALNAAGILNGLTLMPQVTMATRSERRGKP